MDTNSDLFIGSSGADLDLSPINMADTRKSVVGVPSL
jgi:hypothetical protein